MIESAITYTSKNGHLEAFPTVDDERNQIAKYSKNKNKNVHNLNLEDPCFCV